MGSVWWDIHSTNFQFIILGAVDIFSFLVCAYTDVAKLAKERNILI